MVKRKITKSFILFKEVTGNGTVRKSVEAIADDIGFLELEAEMLNSMLTVEEI